MRRTQVMTPRRRMRRSLTLILTIGLIHKLQHARTERAMLMFCTMVMVMTRSGKRLCTKSKLTLC